MSCYVMSKPEIDAMVRLGNDNRVYWYGKAGAQTASDNPDTIGEMLVTENVKSVMHRYNSPIHDLPGPNVPYWLDDYTFHDDPWAPHMTPIQGIKLAHCYQYQACEHPEWEKSDAKVFSDALIHHLIRMVDGYEEATWGLD